jgi:phosphoserine phosphatase RsbU/P
VAATMQGIIHSQLLAGFTLPEIASLVNQFLCSRKTGKYATMILVRLFPNGSVEYLNCGTIPPIVIMDGEVRRLETSSLVVGLIADASYTSAHFTLRPGERLLLTTDGITEAENSSGEQFGDSGLSSVAHFEDLDSILEHVENFRALNPAEDDCTLLEIRYVGGIVPQ